MTARSKTLRHIGAAATLAVGAVHLQQYLDFIHDVPTISVLFVLNGIGAGVVAVLLQTRVRALAALGGIGLSVGALVSLAISMRQSGLFDYVEPTFRAPVVFAIVVELVAVLALGAYLLARRGSGAAAPARAASAG